MLDEMIRSIQQFLDESTYTDATIYSYGYALNRFADFLDIYRIAVESVDAATVARFLRSHEWSNNMRRLYGNAIKSYYRWRFGPQHPACSAHLPKDNARPGRVLDSGQLDNLMVTFDTSKVIGWRNLAIIGLMVETGIRISELCRLEVKHVDLIHRRFDVLAKGQKWRRGIFSETVAQYLDVWLNAREKVARKGVPYVFVGLNGKTKGGKMTPGGLRKEFRKFGRLAEIGQLSPHDLRRTMATLLTEAGAPTRTVQNLGGWSDIRMVERYTRNLKLDQIDRYSPLKGTSLDLDC